MSHINEWNFEDNKRKNSGAQAFFVPYKTERNKFEPSSLPWILYSRWQTRTYSVANIARGVLGSKVHPDTCQMIRVDGQIRFESGYVRTWKFLNAQRKSCGCKNIRLSVDRAYFLQSHWVTRASVPFWRFFVSTRFPSKNSMDLREKAHSKQSLFQQVVVIFW